MSIFDTAKNVANVLKEAGKIEEYKQILELLDKLLELQNKVSEQEDTIKELKGKLSNQDELEYKIMLIGKREAVMSPFVQGAGIKIKS